jgi:hypothetical protein
MNLVERVKNILVTPQTEWPVIEREPDDASALFTSYVAILAAIPPVCGFIGASIIGAAGHRSAFFLGLVGAIIGYLLTFVGIFVLTLIIDALAPSFGGRKNFGNALKLVVYASTASWVAGLFSLVPALAVLSLLGLYSLYLLYLGVPVLMKSPPEKSLTYTIVAIVCAIVVWIVIWAIPALLLVAML